MVIFPILGLQVSRKKCDARREFAVRWSSDDRTLDCDVAMVAGPARKLPSNVPAVGPVAGAFGLLEPELL